MIKDCDVTIVIPTYKEADNIPELVHRIRNACGYIPIIFVDDSPDNKTEEVALSMCCNVIHRRNEKGLSSAVIKGVEVAETHKVIVMDADLQHPPEILPAMIHALKDSTMVVGSRWVDGGSVEGWSLSRVVVSKIANALAYPVAPKIKDRTSGFFGFCKADVDMSSVSPIGWKIGLEIMAKGKYEYAVEVPYKFATRTRGESKFNSKQVINYIKQLVPLYSDKVKEYSRKPNTVDPLKSKPIAHWQ